MTWTRVDKCHKCGAVLTQRTPEQNDKLHAMIQDISEQKQWAGQALDVEDWKRLLVAAWERATGGHIRIFPALDGQGMDVLYRRTSRLTKQECIELIEYITSWAIGNGVKLRDPEAT